MEKISHFNIVGQLLGLIIKDGYKIKYLRVAIAQEEYWIKLDEEIRNHLDPAIVPGCTIQLKGTRKLSSKKGPIKLKAYEVKLIDVSHDSSPLLVVPPSETVEKKKPEATILVCQKSNCWKRGGQAVCQKLEENLRARGLEDQVKIKPTGCLKQCKDGPNLVVMPDKARYKNISAKEVPQLIEKHFSSQANLVTQ